MLHEQQPSVKKQTSSSSSRAVTSAYERAAVDSSESHMSLATASVLPTEKLQPSSMVSGTESMRAAMQAIISSGGAAGAAQGAAQLVAAADAAESELSLCIGLYEALWRANARVRVPDTLVFRKGYLVSWWFTPKSQPAGARPTTKPEPEAKGEERAEQGDGGPARVGRQRSSEGGDATTDLLPAETAAATFGRRRSMAAAYDGGSVATDAPQPAPAEQGGGSLAGRRRRSKVAEVGAVADASQATLAAPPEMVAQPSADSQGGGVTGGGGMAGGASVLSARRRGASPLWSECRIMRKRPATLRALGPEELLRVFRQQAHHGGQLHELPASPQAIEFGRLDGLLQRPPPGGRLPACAHLSYTPHMQAFAIYRAPRAVVTGGKPTGGSSGAHAPLAPRRLPCWLSEPAEVLVQPRISPALEATLRMLAVDGVVGVMQRYLGVIQMSQNS
ncbi:hypothetical protein T492DRAFT_833950 [Pavlovales sp. CCMP2436]|nr:hypothetical protein T492DRAFT_833950 [Pavlovales sp. CCMP2436]